MKRFISTFVVMTVSLAAFLLIALPQAVEAQSNEVPSSKKALCEGAGGVFKDDVCTTPGSTRTVSGTIRQITNTLLFILGAIGVIMIIIGGIRYTVSAGDQAAVTAAKNTIMYAIIGLIIAFMAYAIVNFVFTALKIN